VRPLQWFCQAKHRSVEDAEKNAENTRSPRVFITLVAQKTEPAKAG